MKVCFVVLAHHQPEIFRLLLRNIASPSADIVVHLDRRADLAAFLSPDLPRVHFVRRRNRVHWAGWSQTKTICRTLEYALAVSDADYFIFLAGTDFPIQSPARLAAYLQSIWPANLLNYYPLVPGIWGYMLIGRYHLVDLRTSLANIGTPHRPGVLGSLVRKVEARMNARYRPRNTTRTRIYSGSSRWCLNRDTARYVVDYYRASASRQLKNFLRLSANTDEIFFQTAILNSSHKQACVGFDETEALEIFNGTRPPLPDEKRVYMHYIDWSRERENPAILDEADFDNLKQSEKFFAVKFTDAKSLGLVKRIEKELL